MDDEKRSLITALLVEGGLILFFNSTIYWDLPPEDRHTVIWSLPVGIILLVSAFFSITNEKFYNKWDGELKHIGAWLGVSSLQAFLMITSPVFAVLAINAAGFWIKMRSPYVAVISWLLGITLSILGGWNFKEEKPRLSKSTILWFICVTAFAFLLRAIAMDRIPILLNGDEGSAGVSALDYASGRWNNIFIASWFSFPSFFSFIQSISIRFLGNTVEALRLTSAIGGALTVGAVYLCGKSMFGHRSGLFAALTLASLHIHIHFSRLGLNNIWDSLWFTITIGAVWHGWKNQTRWDYLLAGLGLGLSQYFYASSKALPLILFIATLFAFWFDRARFREAVPHTLALLITATTVTIPLAFYYFREPNALLAPFDRVSLLQEGIFTGAPGLTLALKQLIAALGAYTHTHLVIYYSPETPILRPLPAIFFYAGLIFLLFERHDSRLTILTVWLVLFGFISAASSNLPASQRYVAATPACALVVGYGLHKSAETLARFRSKMQKLIAGMAYLILLTIMVSDLLFYFVTYTGSTYIDELNSNGMLAYQVANLMKHQPDGTQVVFMHNARMSFDSPSILYLAPQIKGVNEINMWESFDKSQLTGERIIFIFLPENYDELDLVQKDFPDGTLTTGKAWNGEDFFWLYEYTSR